MFRFQIPPFNLFECGDKLPYLTGVVVTTIGDMLPRIGIMLLQFRDTALYGFFVVRYRFVPDRRMAAAACAVRTPTDRNGIRAVYRLPDMDGIEYIQLDTLHDGEHTAYPSVFVELLGRVAEKRSALVCPHVKDNLVYAVAETLEISDLFGIVPTDGQEVTQDCVTLAWYILV